MNKTSIIALALILAVLAIGGLSLYFGFWGCSDHSTRTVYRDPATGEVLNVYPQNIVAASAAAEDWIEYAPEISPDYSLEASEKAWNIRLYNSGKVEYSEWGPYTTFDQHPKKTFIYSIPLDRAQRIFDNLREMKLESSYGVYSKEVQPGSRYGPQGSRIAYKMGVRQGEITVSRTHVRIIDDVYDLIAPLRQEVPQDAVPILSKSPYSRR